MNQDQSIREAIAGLEAQRTQLGDEVVDAAIAPLRRKLDALRPEGWADTDGRRLRQVTVLFADVVGSTDMTRQLDPEDVQGIMDSALARLTSEVVAHGGRVLQYAGDSILAAFGADVAHEEDPENAVRTGLAMLAESRSIAADVQKQHGMEGFAIRVGINTGRVLLGGGVDAGNTIRGIAVNVAARMEQTAPAGGLRISHDTFRHVRGVFDVGVEPPIDIKGVAEPVRTYIVHAERERAFRVASRGLDGLETRLVGRQSELSQLEEAFLALHGDDATARLIAVVADAGLGKSRLLYEFDNWAETRPEAFFLFKGRAQPQTRRQPYGLLRDMFAWRLRIAETDSAERARDRLLERMAPLFGDDAAQHVPMLGQLIGLDFSSNSHVAAALSDPQQVRQRGFHAAAQVFRRLAKNEQAPPLILLDDIHWADQESLDFLDYLLEANVDVPMLIVAFGRPGIDERRPHWSSAARHASRIDLSALDHEASVTLARSLLSRLSSVPDVLQDMLMERAAGNPFFMEEIIKMLIDDGAIVSDLDEWRLVDEKLQTASVPGTLRGVLQARLDRLAPLELRALGHASVIGFAFWDGALDEAERAALPTLARRELIVPQAESAFEGHREYAFQHHLLHQVTYEGVLKADRVRYHGRVAEWLEQRVAERSAEFLGTTAEHYLKAEQRDRALECFTQAAQSAAARHARETTLEYVRNGLEIASQEDREARWNLLLARERILATQDDRDAHNADLDELQQLARELDADELRAQALLLKAIALTEAGRYPDAEPVCREVIDVASRCDEYDVAVRALGRRAFALRRMGDFDTARNVVEHGLEMARRHAIRAGEAELLASLRGLTTESGDLVLGRSLSEQDLAITRELGDVARETRALIRLGDSLVRLGDYPQARAVFEEALALAEDIGQRYSACLARLNLGAVAYLLDDATGAVGYTRRALGFAARSGSRDLEAAVLLPLGLAEAALGNAAASREALERSAELFEANAGPHLALEPVAGLAELELEEGRLREAGDCARRVLAHLDAGGSLAGTEEPLRILWTCARVLRETGDSRADEVLDLARRELDAAAERITEPSARVRFLTAIPHHRAIREAAGGVAD